MENIDKRQSRTFSMSEREYSQIENVMEFYRLRSFSDAVRFLVIRENARIARFEAEQAAESTGDNEREG